MNEHDKRIWVTVIVYFLFTMLVTFEGKFIVVPIFVIGCIVSVYMQRREKLAAVKRCGACTRPVSDDAPLYGTFGYWCGAKICMNVMIAETDEALRRS